jgi:hypothetical protein
MPPGSARHQRRYSWAGPAAVAALGLSSAPSHPARLTVRRAEQRRAALAARPCEAPYGFGPPGESAGRAARASDLGPTSAGASQPWLRLPGHAGPGRGDGVPRPPRSTAPLGWARHAPVHQHSASDREGGAHHGALRQILGPGEPRRAPITTYLKLSLFYLVKRTRPASSSPDRSVL